MCKFHSRQVVSLGRRASNRPLTRRLTVFLAALAVGATFSVTEAKTIGTLSIPTITSEPVPITGVNWQADPAPHVSFAITRTPDAASPLLFRRVMQGNDLGTAQIVLSGKALASTTYDLTHVVLTADTVSTDDKGAVTELIQLQFVQLKVSAGASSECWDFLTNTSC